MSGYNSSIMFCKGLDSGTAESQQQVHRFLYHIVLATIPQPVAKILVQIGQEWSPVHRLHQVPPVEAKQ